MPWGQLRRPLAALVGAFVSLALVFGTVDYALAVPSRGLLGALPGVQLLDYARVLGRFVPLTDAFVRKQLHLGGASSSPAAAGGGASSGGGFVAPTGLTGGGGAAGSGLNVSHPFTNDNFANAYVVPGVPFTAHTRTKGATRQGGEPSACARSGGTAWYRYTSTTSQPLEADTFGTSYADSLGVFTGTSLGNLHTVGCSSSPLGNAQVPFSAGAGQTYYFQITGRVTQGRLQFHLAPLGRTTLASVTSDGTQANGDSEESFISATGRYLAFESGAPNLNGSRDPCSDVPLATTQCAQVYLRDLLTGTTRLVSYIRSGLPAVGLSIAPSVSADGRYVAFLSSAVGFVPGLPSAGSCVGETAQFPPTAGRTSLCLHLYRRDMTTGAVTLISANGGRASNGMEFNYSMTDDGQYIAFLSDARNLTPGVRIPRCDPIFKVGENTGGGTTCTQTYLWHAGRLTLVSVHPDGSASIGHSAAADVSADGRYVAFDSEDALVQSQYKPCVNARCPSNTVPVEQNMYVRDMRTGHTQLECLSSTGAVGRRGCVMYTPYTGHFLSADGRYLVFSSTSQNLAPNSPNGAATNAYYIRDRSTRTTIRLDVSNAGNPGVTSHSVSVGSIVVSSDGRWVAFVSADRDLSPQSRHGHQEVYLRDLSTGALWLASESSAGEAGNNDSFNPSLTADGSLLAFDSNASNLAGKDANAGQCPANIGSDCGDIYLHENAGAAA